MRHKAVGQTIGYAILLRIKHKLPNSNMHRVYEDYIEGPTPQQAVNRALIMQSQQQAMQDVDYAHIIGKVVSVTKGI